MAKTQSLALDRYTDLKDKLGAQMGFVIMSERSATYSSRNSIKDPCLVKSTKNQLKSLTFNRKFRRISPQLREIQDTCLIMKDNLKSLDTKVYEQQIVISPI